MWVVAWFWFRVGFGGGFVVFGFALFDGVLFGGVLAAAAGLGCVYYGVLCCWLWFTGL